MIHGRATALYLAQAAAEAYDPAADGIHVDSELCHAVVRRTADGEVIVAFRGTEDAGDWISNGNFLFRAWAGECNFLFRAWAGECRLHAGFYSTYALVADQVLQAIKDLSRPGDQLWFCGHSRGGAHAVVAAFEHAMLGHGVDITGVYTFACPRVGDDNFARRFDDTFCGRAHRYVYQSDVFARLPRIGYRHAGQLHWHDGKAWRDSMPLLTSIGAYLFARKWPFIGDAAADHGIGRYIGALQ